MKRNKVFFVTSCIWYPPVKLDYCSSCPFALVGVEYYQLVKQGWSRRGVYEQRRIGASAGEVSAMLFDEMGVDHDNVSLHLLSNDSILPES